MHRVIRNKSIDGSNSKEPYVSHGIVISNKSLPITSSHTIWYRSMHNNNNVITVTKGKHMLANEQLLLVGMMIISQNGGYPEVIQ